MLNKDLELTLNLAFRFARERRHEYMTVEHLLLALLDNPAAGDARRARRRLPDRRHEVQHDRLVGDQYRHRRGRGKRSGDAQHGHP